MLLWKFHFYLCNYYLYFKIVFNYIILNFIPFYLFLIYYTINSSINSISLSFIVFNLEGNSWINL
jgi:hypothetical protein